MSAAPGRNAACPCGSGRRYKDCHGRLPVEAADAPAAVLARALASHQRGALDEAESGYRQLLARDPRHAPATHYLGMIAWQRGDAAAAEPALRASIALDPAVADFHNNLGLLLRDTGRAGEAVQAFEEAIARQPDWADAFGNLGLAFEALERWEDARGAYEAALRLAPHSAVAHQNLARVMLAQGAFAAAWGHYRWRLAAQGITRTAPDPAAMPLPPDLAGRHLQLVGEQGIGDVLFFLRFAPLLAARGARLSFVGDTRLHAMLERTGLFPDGLSAPESAPRSGKEALWIGDLPALLEMHDASQLPPPLALSPDPRRASGIPGRGGVALTWRAGVASAGPARTQLKQAPMQTLARIARGRGTRFVSIQRQPRPGEREALEHALEAPVEDASALNDDLDAMLAFLDEADDYVGVSNANTHLRAGLGKRSTVLVPTPPEWRWMARGERSPWFPHATIVRLPAAR